MRRCICPRACEQRHRSDQQQQYSSFAHGARLLKPFALCRAIRACLRSCQALGRILRTASHGRALQRRAANMTPFSAGATHACCVNVDIARFRQHSPIAIAYHFSLCAGMRTQFIFSRRFM